MDGLDGWMRVCNTHTRTHTRPCTEGSVSLTQLRHQSLICFVVKAVLFLISVVMESLRCHTTREVSFCAWNKKGKKKSYILLRLYCCCIYLSIYLVSFTKIFSSWQSFCGKKHFRKVVMHVYLFLYFWMEKAECNQENHPLFKWKLYVLDKMFFLFSFSFSFFDILF